MARYEVNPEDLPKFDAETQVNCIQTFKQLLGGKAGSSAIGLQTDEGPPGGGASQRRRGEDDDGFREPYGKKAGDLVGLGKPSTHNTQNLLQIEENENDDYGLEQVDSFVEEQNESAGH